MNSKNKALINYYVRLIQQGTYTLKDVPVELQPQVTVLLDTAKAAEPAVEPEKTVVPQ